VRHFGGLLVKSAVARKERLEDRDRKADPLTRRVAAMAPAGLVPLKKE
jgi:hypothetical protein